MDQLIFNLLSRLLFEGFFSSSKEIRQTTWVVFLSFVAAIVMVGLIIFYSR